jgi:hypothetical protein
MRQATRSKGTKVQVSRSVSIPSPVGGWNARESLANMQPTDAVTLENWFPLTNELMLRKGYTQHATGITGQVESLLPYFAGATDELFAVASGSFYDVSSSGAVGAAVVTGKTNIQGNTSVTGAFTVGSGSLTNLTIGNLRNNLVPTYDWSGWISELRIFNSNQITNRTAIETNINTYYNVF